MKIKLKNKKGQAIVETVIMMPLILFIVFACLQIFLYVLNFSISNYASFKVNREMAVSKKKNVQDSIFSMSVALRYIMPVKNKLYFPMDVPRYERSLDGKRFVLSVFVDYATRIFGSSVARIFPNVIFGGRYYENTARSQMVKAPHEEFYNKAYPQANNFS